MDLFTKDVETYHMQAWVATLNDFLLLRGTQDNTTYQPVTEVCLGHIVSELVRATGQTEVGS